MQTLNMKPDSMQFTIFKENGQWIVQESFETPEGLFNHREFVAENLILTAFSVDNPRALNFTQGKDIKEGYEALYVRTMDGQAGNDFFDTSEQIQKTMDEKDSLVLAFSMNTPIPKQAFLDFIEQEKNDII